MLLTEAAYLDAHPAEGARFGWFHTAGVVEGAFLQAPRHAPVLSRMPDAALESLVDIVAPPFDVDSRTAAEARRIWAPPRRTASRCTGWGRCVRAQTRTARPESRRRRTAIGWWTGTTA